MIQGFGLKMCGLWFPDSDVGFEIPIAAKRLPSTHMPSVLRTSIHDKYSGSMKSTARLDHIGLCKAASSTFISNRWTYRTFLKNTHRDQISLLGVGCTDRCAEIPFHTHSVWLGCVRENLVECWGLFRS